MKNVFVASFSLQTVEQFARYLEGPCLTQGLNYSYWKSRRYGSDSLTFELIEFHNFS